jgi:glycosyltransferase involved in cell wall biosynthesis
VHQENQGLAAARNKGTALALGKYVVSLDADDRISPTYLEKTAWVLENQPHFGFCYSLVQRFGADESIWRTEPFSLEKALRYNHVPTGAMFRREAWVEAGGFRDNLFGQDDWNFWITLGANGWEGYCIDEPLFSYRIHSKSMWSNIRLAEREQTGDVIRSMNAYITGHGDARAAREFNPPQDPMVRAALDQPEGLPAAGCSLSERPHQPSGNGRTALLFAIPWMQVGGAEQVVLQVMKGLAADYALAVATTLDTPASWEEEFASITPAIYHVAHVPVEDPAVYLRDLIAAHHISGLIVSGSALVYQALPALKRDGTLWTADIVHNTVAEGYLETSCRSDPYLDCHFAVGPLQRDALIRKGGVRPEKIRLAPTSVETRNRFNPASYATRLPELRRQLSLTGSEVVLTYTGRLAIEKDVPLFVRVVGEIVRASPRKRFQAFIIGDGPERAVVESETQRQGLQGIVEILGFREDVPEILSLSHFALLTSKFEGSSITLIEAMSMRQIVLSTETGSVRDVISDGVNGFVIPSRSPADFAARILEILGDVGRERAMREQARRTVVERFDSAKMIRVYAESIREGLAERRGAAAGRA